MITRIIELSCDHFDCDAAYKPSIDELISLRLTRIGSAVCGWTQQGGLDFCPAHRRETRVDAIRRLASQRLTDGQIGQRLGISRAAVQKIRAAEGIAPGLGRVGRPSVMGGAR